MSKFGLQIDAINVRNGILVAVYFSIWLDIGNYSVRIHKKEIQIKIDNYKIIFNGNWKFKIPVFNRIFKKRGFSFLSVTFGSYRHIDYYH